MNDLEFRGKENIYIILERICVHIGLTSSTRATNFVLNSQKVEVQVGSKEFHSTNMSYFTNSKAKGDRY